MTVPKRCGPRRRCCRARRAAGLVLLLLAAGIFACGRKEPEQEAKPVVPLSEQVWVRHILIQYAGSYGAPPELKRSRASADSLARALLARIRTGEDLGALARQYSDDPSASDGGEIAELEPGDAPQEFMEAAAKLEPGAVSEVVESSWGFHIIQRRDLRRVTLQHILLRYRGAVNSPDSIVRTREEALARAEHVLAQVRNPDASFPVAAREFSDDASNASTGGYLGALLPGKMEPSFEKAAEKLQEWEISDIVETPYGFHILRRIPDLRIRVAHILVTFEGTGQMVTASRTREQALQRALDVAFRARQGEDFAALAREFSDDAHSGQVGGKLPIIRAGQTVPEFEDVAFHLKPGEVSEVVESHFGFHVIKRLH